MTEEKKLNITFPAVFIGIVGAILVSASSFYIVLKFGALPWPTIMVTLLSMITLKFFKRADNKEITITHTIMRWSCLYSASLYYFRRKTFGY